MGCIRMTHSYLAGVGESLYQSILNVFGSKSLALSSSCSHSFTQMLVSSTSGFGVNHCFTFKHDGFRISISNHREMTPEFNINNFNDEPYTTEPNGSIIRI